MPMSGSDLNFITDFPVLISSLKVFLICKVMTNLGLTTHQQVIEGGKNLKEGKEGNLKRVIKVKRD